MLLPRVVLAAVFALLCTACPAKQPSYPSCAGDKDCKAGQKCVDKLCVGCAADSDCARAEQCVKGACAAVPGWCSGDGDCDNGEVCKANRCTPCVADADCGEGGHCIDGGCLRKGQCRTDDDCPEELDCVRGVCTSSAKPAGEAPGCTLEPVLFAFEKFDLADDAKAALQKNADCLASLATRVAVRGLTDSRGPDEYNVSLSDDRAQSVITYLVRLGIDPARLRKVPLGEGEATGADEAGWARDRRVEFVWE